MRSTDRPTTSLQPSTLSEIGIQPRKPNIYSINNYLSIMATIKYSVVLRGPVK